MHNFTQLVRLGWNDYAMDTKAERIIQPEHSVLKMFSDLLIKSDNILDVGCGSGKPITEYFYKEGHKIQGLDISPHQAAKAARIIGENMVAISDMTNYDYPKIFYGGIICLHSLVHTERSHHVDILKKFHDALKPGGLLLISVNLDSKEGLYPLTSKIQMFYSHFDKNQTLTNIHAANFSIINSTEVIINNNKYLYVIAKKPERLVKENDTHILYSSVN